MKSLPVAALLLLLLSLAEAGIEEPKLVSVLESDYRDSGTILVLNGQWYSLELNLTVPQERAYQEVTFPGGAGPAYEKNDDGNAFFRFFLSKPPNPFNYSIHANVRTLERRTTSLPSSYNLSSSMLPFLNGTEKAQSDHPAVKQLAEDITSTASTDFERIALLAIWVSENIQYDLSYVNKNKDAITVMQEKRGVCLEHSNMFTALARSLGYPTRYLLGKAYGSYGWLGHSWNEVYLGDWVAVDPTWLEVGSLDATHIEFYRSEREKLSNEVRANATAEATLYWPKEESFFGASDGSGLSILSTTAEPPSDDYELVTAVGTVGRGDRTVIYMEMEGDEYDVMKVVLQTCRPEEGGPEVVTVDEPVQYMIFEPGKASIASWVVQGNSQLEEGMIYTCPLTLNSDRLTESVATLKIRSDYSAPGVGMSIEKPTMALGSEQTVTVFVDGEADELGIISGRYTERKAPIDGEATFTFTPTNPGENDVTVFSSSGGVSQGLFYVRENSSVSIKDIEVPSAVMVGHNFNANLTLENTLEPRTVKVTAIFGSQSESRNVELDGTKALSFEFTAAEEGQQLLRVILSGGPRDEAFIPVKVMEKPVVKLASVNFVESGSKYYTKMVFTTSSTVVDLHASIDGKEVIGEAELSSGPHVVVLSWKDLFGNSYSSSETVVVPEHSSSNLSDSLGELWFMLLLILLFVFLLALAVLIAVAKRWRR